VIRFLVTRVVSGVVILVVVAMLTFFLLYFSSDDIAHNLLSDDATADQIRAKEIELGLDQPLVTQFLNWAGAAIHGDFGKSWFSGLSVSTTLSTRLPTTLSVVLVATIVAAILATLLGTTAAVFHRGWVDRVLQVVSVGSSALPQFVVAIVLVTVFAVQLHWFPATGFTPLDRNPGKWAISIVLPVTAVVLGMVASTAQQVRSAMIAERGKDYIRTLRSRGLPAGEILFGHALRGAAPAGLTILSVHFVGVLSGAVIIETIFALPGLGQLAVQSALLGDTPSLMGVVCAIVVLVVIVNLLVDLAVGWLNPKARIS